MLESHQFLDTLSAIPWGGQPMNIARLSDFTRIAILSTQNAIIVFEVDLGDNPRAVMHSHDFTEILLCTHGHGCQRVASHSFEFSPGEVLFFPPGQPHFAYAPTGNTCRVTVLYLSTDSFSTDEIGGEDCRLILDLLQDAAEKGENLCRQALRP